MSEAVEEREASKSWVQPALIALVLVNIVVVFFWSLPPKLFSELSGHRTSVNCAAVSSNGKFLATSTDAGVIRLWDENGELLQKVTGHSDSVISMAFSHEIVRLATGGANGEIRVWSVPDGIEIASLQRDEEPVLGIAFSASGEWLYSVGPESTVRVWDVFERRMIDEIALPSSATCCVLIDASSKLLLGCSDGAIRLCDLSTNKVTEALVGHLGSVTGLAMNASGKTLATSSEDRTVRLWDFTNRKQLAEFKSNAVPQDLAFCSNDRRLIAGTEHGWLHLYDVATRKRVKHLASPLSQVLSVCNDGNDRCLISGTRSKAVLFSIENLIAQ